MRNDTPEYRTIKTIEIQNIGDDGSVILDPNKVANTVLGNVPKALASRYLVNGVLTAPRYILTTSPGNTLSVLKKKQIKVELLFCFSIKNLKGGYFFINRSIAVVPEK